MTRFLIALSILLNLVAWGFQAAAVEWLDQSHEVFLTKKLNAVTGRYRDFPVFWWNFVVVDRELSAEQSEDFCQALHEKWQASISKLPCHFTPAQLGELTHDWLADLPGRRPLPDQATWDSSMNSVLAKAAMPLPRELLNLMRRDPLNSLGELKAKLDRRQPFDLPLRGGMIVDPVAKQTWIPVQLNYSPTNSSRTEELSKSLPAGSLFGPHFATFENERRIREDINVVSVVGTLSMILLALFVFFTGRQKIILLIPILIAGLGLAAAVTVLVFGKIHGITLAFGPGIVGLAMDYGVHAVFMDPRSKATWKSNLAGLLTTLVILLILVFSQIPLLRQLMFFSAFGLIISFLLFYVFLHAWPRLFETKPYGFTPKTWVAGEYIAIIMLAACLLVFLRPLDLSVQHLNYESAQTVRLRNWFAKHSTSLQPYWLEENLENPLASSHATKTWADENRVAYEGAASFLPEKPQASWATWAALCKSASPLRFTAVQKQFFSPFFEEIACHEARIYDLKNGHPDYLGDFTSQGQWASLLFPANEEQVAKLKNRFPAATTPREIFSEFPKIFLRELGWMVPVAFLTALIFLFFHFRHLGFTLLSVVPFLTGAGCFAIVATVFQLPLSFISLIGLLMVFGFSLDYGIFVVDLLREHNENKYGVWSALSVCSFSAVVGFVPLIFAGHPVLNDLGQTLLWGSLGTFIGTFWGIPGLYRRIFA